MRSVSLAVQILHCVLLHRRLLQGDENNRFSHLISHLKKVEFFMENQKPIHFVLPAFPAKSPNPEKVLGPLPDMGERISLEFLQSLCERIQCIYPPGAKITICSDGRVFNDLVCVSDENVTAYSSGIEDILRHINACSLDTFCMEKVFIGASFSSMRERLINYSLSQAGKVHGRVSNALAQNGES